MGGGERGCAGGRVGGEGHIMMTLEMEQPKKKEDQRRTRWRRGMHNIYPLTENRRRRI